MEEKAKPGNTHTCPLGPELQDQTKTDLEFAKKVQTAERIAERYSDALQRLADS
jgi:hypothetical protein